MADVNHWNDLGKNTMCNFSSYDEPSGFGKTPPIRAEVEKFADLLGDGGTAT